MSEPAQPQAAEVKVGPVRLERGIRKSHFWTFMYASFICIGMLAGMNFLQSYVLTEHLQVPLDKQGSITGDLALWTEIIAILLIVPFGILSDRIGRRPVMVIGTLFVAGGYALFPFASSVAELIACRVVFAIGAAALSALIAVVGNDYTQEVSRGRLFGFMGLMNGLGVIFMSLVIARIPAVLTAKGVDPVVAGIAMFLAAAGLCVVSAMIFARGLKGGTPAEPGERLPLKVLITSGLRAASNPRVALAYGAAFAGRGDNAVKGLFVSLWAVQLAPVIGMTVPEALAGAGKLMGLMGAVILVWTPLFGYLLDRLDRVTGMALAMGLAGLGYTSMMFIDNPLASSSIPLFVLLAIGQGSAIIGSVTLVGQEAPPKERGTVVATSGMFGAVGILIATGLGGRLFDAFGPSAPFVFVGVLQLILFVVAVLIRIAGAGRAQTGSQAD